MATAQLLYIENIISRQRDQVVQSLNFLMTVENLGFDKTVDILWAGEDGKWYTLAAKFHSMQGGGREYWMAGVQLNLSESQTLSGNIQCSVRYRVLGKEYWDSNHGKNYASEADSGIKLAQGQLLQNIDIQANFQENQTTIPIKIAVDMVTQITKVTVHWTIDRWKTTHLTVCGSESLYWNKNQQSNARNPNQYKTQLWTGNVDAGDSYHLEYIISCEKQDGQMFWDNNQGHNYRFQRKELKVLVLNLHCYQESNQDEKLTTIAQAINELDADIICLQEVAEYWRDGEGDWESNTAKIINDRLPKPFYLHTDWSHLGFDKYREGVAILSRYPLINLQAKYVSDSHDIYSIHSRKVVFAQAYIPYIGLINVFSAHLSWVEDGFEGQFKQLDEWAADNHTNDVIATLLCGDFNVTAGSEGYGLVVDSQQYEDQFLKVNQQGIFDQVFKVHDAHWHDLLTDDYRIDYIFTNKDSQLSVSSARVIFTDDDGYGRVSDHCGYVMAFDLEGF